MNCEKCVELLSDFYDGTLAVEERAQLHAHLGGCLSCADVRDELHSIVSVAQASRGHLVAPPNERALWLRIRNTIEVDLEAQRRAESWADAASASRREGFLSGLFGKRWSLSLSQLAGTVAAIAIGTSLITTYGVQRLVNGGQSNVVQTENMRPADRSTLRRNMNPDQMLAIEYLKQRVEQRKARWNPQIRAAFDRNLGVIDETVNECLLTLDREPHDEVSEDALNMALRDKMQLLREFSEL
ncbi:MAG: anti-sigma factor family protein [Pyrinomonadaceae bacterium]